MCSLKIELTGTKQELVICDEVLQVFADARQMSAGDKETGGILFAEISKSEVRIVRVTRAEKRASISRVLFRPSLRQKRIAVKEAFNDGLHFVGEWHTHPERDPSPSSMDEESMEDSFKRSKHELNRFLMIILGNRKRQLSLAITLHSDLKVEALGLFKIPILET